MILYPLLTGTQVLSSGDTSGYQEAANNMLHGYHQINFRVPFYPLILLATGSVNQLTPSLFWLQFILYFLSVALLVKAMVRAGLDAPLVFLITLVLVSPMLVKNVYLALTETVSFALVNMLFALFIILKGRYKYLLLGLIAAAITLTRPSFQLTGILLTILFFFIRKSKVCALLFFIGFATPIFSFSWFNKNNFNFFGITPATGWHLTTKTALFIDNWPDKKLRPLMIRQRNDNLVNKSSHTGTMFVWTLPQMLQDTLHLNYVDASKYMMKNNVALIKAQPLDYLQAVGRSLFQYTLPNGISASNSGWQKALYTAIQFAYIYLSLVLTVVVLVCIWLFGRKLNKNWLYPFLIASVIIFSNYFASVAAEVGDSRHRTPTEGLILISIAFALPIAIECKKAVSRQPSYVA